MRNSHCERLKGAKQSHLFIFFHRIGIAPVGQSRGSLRPRHKTLAGPRDDGRQEGVIDVAKN